MVENARRKRSLKHGGDRARHDLDDDMLVAAEPAEDLVALDAALTKLAAADPQAAQLVQLRYFAGLPLPEVADMLGISPRTADRLWAYARAWLHRELASRIERKIREDRQVLQLAKDGDWMLHPIIPELRAENVGDDFIGIDQGLAAGPMQSLQRLEQVGPVLFKDSQVALEIKPLAVLLP